MVKLRFPLFLIIAGILSLFIIYTGFWITFIHDPVERTGSDFISYYSVGRIAQIDGWSHAYDPLLQQKVEEEVVGFPLAPGQVLLNLHLPFLIPFLYGIVNSDYVTSFYRWDLFILLIFVLSIVLLARKLKEAQVDNTFIILISLEALLFYPFFFSLLNGQDTSLVFLGVSLWSLNLLSGKEFSAGLGLSLVVARPHMALFLALPMLARNQKVFWGFVTGTGLLAALSIAILGLEGTKEFINVTLIGMNGEWFGLNQKYMFNLLGLLLRTMPWLPINIIHAVRWIAFGVGIVVLFLLFRKKDPRDGALGPVIVAAVFLAPHLHFHDLTLLLIPFYELFWREPRQENSMRNMAFLLVTSFILLIGNGATILKFSIPYLLMLGLAIYPYYSQRMFTSAAPHRS